MAASAQRSAREDRRGVYASGATNGPVARGGRSAKSPATARSVLETTGPD
jgi:hypothetical protein